MGSQDRVRQMLTLLLFGAALIAILLGSSMLRSGPANPTPFLIAFCPAAIFVSINRMNEFMIRFMLQNHKSNNSINHPNVDDDAFKTVLVVYCVLLVDESAIASLLKKLSALRAASANLRVGLLLDFPDSPCGMRPDEHDILCRVQRTFVEAHQQSGGEWYLFFRDRTFDAIDGSWRGWERKRGKVLSLLELIEHRGQHEHALHMIYGTHSTLQPVKWVLTLDEDNVLSLQSLCRLLATAKKLWGNSPSEPRTSSAVPAILQPAILATAPEKTTSYYKLLHFDGRFEDDIDKPTQNFYHDTFSRGSYYGKGLINVSLFLQRTASKIPDNLALSHDLLEGELAGTRYMPDTFVHEDTPNSHASTRERAHRWTRGDWQLARWLIAGKNTEDIFGRAHLDALSKWKIFDNMQRSIAPAAIFICITGLSFTSGLWCVIGTGFFVFLFLTPLIFDIISGLRSANVISRRVLWYNVLSPLLISMLKFGLVPIEAVNASDALARSLWRQCISKKRLLEWKPFASSQRFEQFISTGALRYIICAYLMMAPLIAAWAMLGLSIAGIREALILCWTVGPLIALLLSSRRSADDAPPLHQQTSDYQIGPVDDL